MVFSLHTVHTAVWTMSIEFIYAAGLRANGSVAKIHMWLATAQGSIVTMHCVLDRKEETTTTNARCVIACPNCCCASGFS